MGKMTCPGCKDEITGLVVPMEVKGVMYKEWDGVYADLCSYPELQSETASFNSIAECMDCGHKAKLREFFPGDINA